LNTIDLLKSVITGGYWTYSSLASNWWVNKGLESFMDVSCGMLFKIPYARIG
jgi:hypothetical protein